MYNRQIQLAKSILESKGYKVNKSFFESSMNEVVSESEYKDPIRLSVKSDKPVSEEMIKEISQLCFLPVEIFISDDNTIVVNAPGREDWIYKLEQFGLREV